MQKYFSKFRDLNEDLQSHFLKQFLYIAGIVLVAITALFYTNSLFIFCLFIATCLLYVMLTYYRLLMCYEGKIIYLEGQVEFIYDKKNIKDKFTLERTHFVIKQNGDTPIFIKIYYSNIKKVKEDNIVKVYINPKNLKTLNEDTYSCDSIFHVVVKKSKSVGNKKPIA